MQIATVIWDISPNLISFTDSYAIRWYGVLFSLGYVFGYLILQHAFKKEGLPIFLLEKMTLATLIGGVLGARLGHCLFYEPLQYIYNPLRILYIWEGGLASHGGAIGILIAYYIVAQKEKVSFFHILSRLMLVVPLAAALIRIGNLINSEIYGIETHVPWGFIFMQSIDVVAGIEKAIPRHPTQIYEALSYLFVFGILQWYYWKQIKNQTQISDWLIQGIFLIGMFTARFVVEFLKVDQVSFENGMFLNMGQLLSLPFIVYGGFAIYKHFTRKELVL